VLLSFLLLLAAPQTQAQMTQAAGTAYTTADAAMTRQWQATYAAMKRRDAQDISRGGGHGFAGALLASQRAWLKYRDTECVIEGGEYAGGSMLPMVIAQCRTRLTVARTAQLKTLIWNH
jgi:uncharacterized protein YecT (DUF1311 family)